MRDISIKFIFFLSFLSLLSSCEESPIERDTFIKFFGGAFNQKAFDFQASPDGEFYVIVGSSRSFGANPLSDQIFVITTDINGNRLNQNSFGNDSLTQEGKDIAFTQNGDILIAAYTDSLVGTQSAKLSLLRVNTNLDSLEQQIYDITVDPTEKLYISPSSDGGFVLLGTIPEAGDALLKDMILLKIDADLQPEYSRRYGLLSRNDIAGSLLIENDDITWCGTANRRSDNTDSDMRILRADPSGELIWTFDFDENNNTLETGRDIQRSGNGYVMVGSKANTGREDIFVVEVEVDENRLITSTNSSIISLANGVTQTIGESIFPVSDENGGGFVIAGSLTQNDNPGSFLLKLDANLQLDPTWPVNPQIFGGDADANSSERSCDQDQGQIVRPTPDGGFLILSTICFEANSVISLIKTNNLGELF